jgi:hypothetical protein
MVGTFVWVLTEMAAVHCVLGLVLYVLEWFHLGKSGYFAATFASLGSEQRQAKQSIE